MQKKRRILFSVIAGILLITLSVSITQLWKICRGYVQESKQHQELYAYKPTEPVLPATEPDDSLQAVVPEKVNLNQSVIDLKTRYPDAIGWLTVDGTKIDYPFVQSKDNQTYLRRDMDFNYLDSGTVFIDYRNASNFSDFTTVLYGHHMKNNSMFGTMKWFRSDDFFLENSTGRIYLPDKVLELEIVAVVVVSSDDETVYEFGTDTDEERQEFINYVYENAEQLREGLGLTPEDTFVLLSTCVYDFEGARMVLVTRIVNDSM